MGDIVKPMKEIPEGVDREAIVRAVSAAVKPKRIILFGSRARGDSKPDSDTDICVIVDKIEGSQFGAGANIHRRLFDEAPGSYDILLYEESNFDERRVFRSTVEYTIAREGVLLYDGP
jgi:predicted nucleotidyltransferase